MSGLLHFDTTKKGLGEWADCVVGFLLVLLFFIIFCAAIWRNNEWWLKYYNYGNDSESVNVVSHWRASICRLSRGPVLAQLSIYPAACTSVPL